MSLKLKIILTTLLFAVPAFILGPQIWPSPMASMEPTRFQLPFFLILGLFESIVFGLGISFLIFGWNWVKKVSPASKTLTTLVYLSIAWDLISWWPHDGLHRANGMDLQGLLYIEYGFHVTLMLTSLILAYFFLKTLKVKAS
jgi:hypothetical protein